MMQADEAQLKPYLSLLKAAAAMGGGQEDCSVVEQSGFEGLHALMDAASVPPTCPICYLPCRHPAVTPCVHLACAACIVHWLEVRVSGWRHSPLNFLSFFSRELRLP
jgi:hypothetical protein